MQSWIIGIVWCNLVHLPSKDVQPARAATLLLGLKGRIKSLTMTTVRRYGRRERCTDVVAVVLVRYDRREKCTDNVVLVVAACNQQELLRFYWDLKGGCPTWWWCWGYDDMPNRWPKREVKIIFYIQFCKLSNVDAVAIVESGAFSLRELCHTVMWTWREVVCDRVVVRTCRQR